MQFRGVMPAITTPFREDGAVDHEFLARHASWLVDHGSTAIIALGSLGEGATLSFAEKSQLLRTLVDAVGDRHAPPRLGAIWLHSSTSPLTDSTDFVNICRSLVLSSISTIRSTPFPPITTGTPT